MRAGLPLFVGAVVALMPVPGGLTPGAWYYFALFAAVVVALILEPVPAAVVGLSGVTLAGVLRLVDPSPEESVKWALSGFSNPTVWLIAAAFMFALGYQRTGLGRRIALMLVSALGRSTLGLGYAIGLSDLILAPFMPSNTARSGGTIYPIIRNIPGLYGSRPGETARKIGSYLMWTALAVTCVTSSMFMTALAPNLLAVELIKKTVNVEISWTTWFVGFLPVGAVLFLSLPFLIYKLYPPEIKVSTEVPLWAKNELSAMGALTRKEIVMAGLALLALALWVFGQDVFNTSAVALGIVCLMIVTGVVSWDDVLSNTPAWNVLIWFATLVALANGLAHVGFAAWLGTRVAAFLYGFPPVAVMVILVLALVVTHYLFASVTAHVMAMLPLFLAAGAAVPGMNVPVLTLLLAYALGIMGILTPYATGPSPIYFASGYIPRKDFWLLGLICGALFVFLLLVLGLPYLSAIHAG